MGKEESEKRSQKTDEKSDVINRVGSIKEDLKLEYDFKRTLIKWK